PSLTDPGVPAVVPAEPVFRAPHTPSGPDEIVDAGPDPSPVVRMEAFLPPRSGGLDLFGPVAEHGGHVVVHPHAVRLEIPVPHDIVRRPTEQQEPLLAPAETLFGARALGHVERDPDRPEDLAFFGTERRHVDVV